MLATLRTLNTIALMLVLCELLAVFLVSSSIVVRAVILRSTQDPPPWLIETWLLAFAAGWCLPLFVVQLLSQPLDTFLHDDYDPGWQSFTRLEPPRLPRKPPMSAPLPMLPLPAPRPVTPPLRQLAPPRAPTPSDASRFIGVQVRGLDTTCRECGAQHVTTPYGNIACLRGHPKRA